MSNRIPVILGTTASGKTSVGIELARLLDGEIISIDSRKVYKGLVVGTAVPDGAMDEGGAWVSEGVRHHLIGHLSPDKPYTAGDFVKDAERLIDDITARGKRPILVGGTGFYFKALHLGLPGMPKSDDEVRAALDRRANTEGLPAIRRELEKVDPEAAKAIQANDRQKNLRALEVYLITGKPFSQWRLVEPTPSRHDFAVMALSWPKPEIERRIEERSAYMAENGMIEETEALITAGFSPGCHALASFGYREAVQVVKNEITRMDFLPRLIAGTKAYAKRQRTWFRTQADPVWFECDSNTRKDEISMRMRDFLAKSN